MFPSLDSNGDGFLDSEEILSEMSSNKMFSELSSNKILSKLSPNKMFRETQSLKSKARMFLMEEEKR